MHRGPIRKLTQYYVIYYVIIILTILPGYNFHENWWYRAVTHSICENINRQWVSFGLGQGSARDWFGPNCPKLVKVLLCGSIRRIFPGLKSLIFPTCNIFYFIHYYVFCCRILAHFHIAFSLHSTQQQINYVNSKAILRK